MKLKILSTIAAISATATSAASLTCGDVQTLYQDDGCCTAAGQTCLKSLSIAAGSTSELNLSNTGELSLDLTSFSNQKLDTSVLEASAVTGGDGVTFAKVLKYTRFDGGIQANSDVSFNGAVTFANALTIQQVDSGIGPNKIKEAIDSQYRPAAFSSNCPNHHGFESFVYNWDAQTAWEMKLNAGDQSEIWSCVVKQLNLISADVKTDGKFYASGIALTSDSRIKKDIVDADIEDALQKVRDIELKEYAYNNPQREGEKTVGFIAQQVKEVYPDAVHIDIQSNTIWNEAGERVEIYDLHRINKDKIFALHHGALQYLDAKIATLEARLAALEPQPTP